ncbi:Transposase and inactivated derivatives, partial [Anaerocolumna aminovalerica]
MAKYSFEFKKKIVTEYLEGKDSSNGLAKKYGIPQGKMVRNWISNYNEFGDDGLRRSRKKVKYSFEFKLHMVELYLSSEVSYQDLAFSNGI